MGNDKIGSECDGFWVGKVGRAEYLKSRENDYIMIIEGSRGKTSRGVLPGCMDGTVPHSYAQVNAIQPMVELMPMARINDAIERVKENKARYRIVLVNE